MATLEENIKQAISDFDNIKAAIKEKGVDVPDGTDTKEYGGLIRSIPTDDTNGSYDEGYSAGEKAGYDSGYEKGNSDGYSNGKTDGYNEGSALKDKKPYINSINMIYWENFFNATKGNPIELVENCDFSSGKNFRDCFSGQKTTITEIELNSPYIENLMQPFYNCQALTKITLGNTSNCTNIAGMCNQCRSLVEIIGEPIDMTNVTVAGSAFNNCTELVTVSFVNGSIGINVNFSYSSKLSLASAKSILLGLKNLTGTDEELTKTITLHANTWDLLDADGATSPDGTTWADYTSAKGWNF